MNVAPRGLAQAYEIANMRSPKQGSRAYGIDLDFTSVASIDGNLMELIDGGEFDFLQSVYVDNADNAAALTLTMLGGGASGQRMIIPAGSQAMLPVSVPVGLVRYNAATTLFDGLNVSLIFFNVPFPYFIYSTLGATFTSSIVTGSFTDRSGSIAAGGVSQQIMAANANRKRIIIQNLFTAGENLAINFGAVATIAGDDSIVLVPGGTFDTGTGPCPTSAVQVNATTIAHKYMAKEM